MIRGAVFGFGNMGRKFTRFINESPDIDAQVVVAVNRGKPNLEIAENEFGLAATHSIHDALDMDLDFVIVASTTVAHTEQVVAAAEKGCHVFCEKPIALNLDDADQMISAIERAGVVSVVNYIMRFNPAYLRIKEMIQAGDLGDVLSVAHHKTRGYGLHAGGARHRAIQEPDESGGWAVHHACHDLDFLYWTAGDIESVYGLTATTVPSGTSEEVVEALLKFTSGAVGSVADSVSILRQHYTRVLGSKASVLVTGEKDTTVFLVQEEGFREGERPPRRLDVQDRKAPGGGLRHFFECIRNDRMSPHSLSSARPSLEAGLAIRESARTGLPVRLR